MSTFELESFEEEVPNGWDEHFCFNIADFTPGSAIIVNRRGSRERGVVTSADEKSLTITYRNARNELLTVGINSIGLLQDWERNWLN